MSTKAKDFGRTPQTRFATYADRWLERRVQAGLRSEKDYRSILDRWLIPAFGIRPMSAIKPRDVRDFIAALRSRKRSDGTPELSPRTILHVYAKLRAIFADAVRDEVLDRSPCVLRGKTELPPNLDRDPYFKTRSVFTREELAVLLDDPKLPRHRRTLYWTLLATGARVGELLALKWEDVRFARPGDTELGSIFLAKSYDAAGDRDVETKTGIPKEVPIHPKLVPVLAEWHHATGVAGDRPALVFARRTGRLTQATVRAWLRDDLARLGLRPRRVHDFRRTFITLACRSPGIDAEVIRLCTHKRRGDVYSTYRETTFTTLQEHMRKVEL